ncbi:MULTISPECIES: tyrosine-type recombinase/integrase [Mammaliicoccus]|uniref:tyrosine-type recombinase/integrase n=1 Tax=Mammaliicoccus sp. JADD-157 TaxID=3404818 RepID=UPI0028F119C9|nr:tyrosine-type recombinase/integrase [Mammaliicoccus lentus]
MKISKRGNKWQYDFRYDGNRYRKSGFPTKKEATEKGNEIYNQLTKGFNLTNDISFIDYYKSWLQVNKEGQLSDKSIQRYKSSIEVFEEKFGDLPINKLTQLKYRELLKEYGEGLYLKPRKDGRTTNSVQKLHLCLRAALQDAMNEGIIVKDPTYKAKPYGIKSAQHESAKFMTIDNYINLKNYVTDRKELSYLFIYILIITGARFGEVQKLKYSDLKRKENLLHLPGTKTETSDRTIPITEKEMSYLINNLKDRPIQMNGYIFNTGKSLISNNAVTKVLNKFCLENKIGSYTLHSIRHTHCSYLLHKGVSIHYISKRLGHANVTTTLSIYSHLLEEIDKEETVKLRKIMNDL